jgi:hypothetical protein
MGAAILTSNLLIEQGSTFSRDCTVKDALGAAIDLTGYSVRGKIRVGCDSTTALAEFTCTIKNQSTNKGQFSFGLSATTTAALPVPENTSYIRVNALYTFDLELVYPTPDTTVIRILQGTVEVSPEATK